jgi:transposase
MLKYSVGLDVSGKKIDGCMSVIDTNQKVIVKSSIVFSNDLKGFKVLENWILKHYKEKSIPLVVCMEATGIYYESCALYLFEKKFNVSVILPNKAKQYFQAIGLKSKNDTIDARGLAQMGAERCLRTWQPLAKFYYELRLYTRQHQNLQEQKTVINNQLKSLECGMYTNKKILKQLQKLISILEKQLIELDKLIKDHIKSNEEIQTKANNICKIKGVGILTFATIIAETNGFELFENSKQLVSYAGFDVVENQSGSTFGRTKISKKGNSRIRRALFMPAFTVITYRQKPFIELFERTLEKHNIKMKSYVAVQKKILTIVYSLWKKNEMYDNNFQIDIQEEEQKLSSRAVVFEEDTDEKISPKQVEAKQGKHPVNYRKKLPLGDVKLEKITI